MDEQLKLFLIQALRKELVTVQVFIRLVHEKADLDVCVREGLGILGVDWSLLDAAARAICLRAGEDARTEIEMGA
jgi:hypothetical protein